MTTGRATPALLLLAWLMTLPSAVQAATAPGPEDEDAAFRSLGLVVTALREDDEAALAELVDFERRAAERFWRGAGSVRWEDLDPDARAELVDDALYDWVGRQRSFLKRALLYDFRRVEDPDAGRGPVPDRIVIQGVLNNGSQRRHRDLLLTTDAEGRVLDLELGSPYPEGPSPAGLRGMLPRPTPRGGMASLQWPEDADHQERAATREVALELEALDEPAAQAVAVESLHRVPHAAVAALIERLGALLDEPPDAGRRRERLSAALVTITGRPGMLRDAPAVAEDTASWREANRAELDGWLRWHAHHRDDFRPAPILAPLHPIFAEREARPGPGRRPELYGLERAQAAEEAGEVADTDDTAEAPIVADADDAAEAPAPRPRSGEDVRGDDARERGTGLVDRRQTGHAEQHGLPLPDDEDDALPGDGDTSDDAPAGPKVVLRDPVPTTAPDLTDLPLLVVGLDGEVAERTYGDVSDRLPASTRAVLADWAETLEALQLRVVLTGNPDQVVLARCRESTAVRAAGVIDDAWDRIDPLVPVPLTGHGGAEAVVAVLFDEQALIGTFWRDLIDDLLGRDLITAAGAVDLARDPRGFTARSRGLFVQPVWDMAGDASRGDDEFRLDHEVAHKFAQCLLTQRRGPMPEGLTWALGHYVELRLYDSVYQFDKDGFVAVGDHFDWHGQAARLLEKRGRRRAFDLVERVMAADDPGGSLDDPLVAWAVLDLLATERTEDLRTLWIDLTELQRAARPLGDAPSWAADRDATRTVLGRRLAAVSVDDVVDHLERRR